MYARKKRYASLTYRALCSVANLAALVPLVYFVAFKHRTDDSEVSGSSESASAVFLGQPHILDRLPNSLRDRYDEIDADLQYGMLMTKRERQLIRDIWARYPLSFLFVLKCAMKIMAYCDIIDKSGAKAIMLQAKIPIHLRFLRTIVVCDRCGISISCTEKYFTVWRAPSLALMSASFGMSTIKACA